MDVTALIKDEINGAKTGGINMRRYYMGRGYLKSLTRSVSVARAEAFCELLRSADKHIYANDPIAGSVAGLILFEKPDDFDRTVSITDMFGSRSWLAGSDHFAPDFSRLLEVGVGGLAEDIEISVKKHADDPAKTDFLTACGIAVKGFSEMIAGFRDAAEGETRACLDRIVTGAPRSFRDALQLVWLAHTAFRFMGLYAMALGRIDRYLYPFYERDRAAGRIDFASAVDLVSAAFVKIGEWRVIEGYDDVVNICIGGITPDGSDAVTELSYVVLEAVKRCAIPGPNLSARVHPKNPDVFLEECLKVIGTGIGYPALMNDLVNVAALKRSGYAESDANDYCMVGCIENFSAGKQPPWSDGRFDVPRLLEYTLNRGRSFLTGKKEGADVGDPCKCRSMAEFMAMFEAQLAAAADEYVCKVRFENSRQNNRSFENPFMSCLTTTCIERGLDVCSGGTEYPSVHGICCMGIATVADSLAAIEKRVFSDGGITMERLILALQNNFSGFEIERKLLISVPKYGNNCDETDKFAVWYVEFIGKLFSKYSMPDGGKFSVGIASNISNIECGAGCGASADGRQAGQPVSDAASPSYGRDTGGVTFALSSLSKPDYTLTAVGTVVNQKYSPEMLKSPANIKRMTAAVRVYFDNLGQELQINSVSREVLTDAMKNPEKYSSLVVRVSGFSAYYVALDRAVQLDILHRTEH